MAIYCCPKCGSWNSCEAKWVRSEKGEVNLCCSSCGSYGECIRRDIDSILEERASRLDWLRNELSEAINPKVDDEDYVQGLNPRDFKAFIANYALSGFWIIYGLETKFLERNIFYTLAIIPSILIFWIVLKKIQKVVAKKI